MRSSLQDDTQRQDPVAAPTSAAQQPAPIGTAGTPPLSSTPGSTVSPRGLVGLRSEPAAEPSRFNPLPFGPERGEPLPFHTDLDTSLGYGYDHQEPMYLPLALSVGAGFKFGCGFMLAVGVSLFGLFLAASVIFFVAALAGVPVPGTGP